MNNDYFGGKKIACLDIHSPLYLNSRTNKYGGGDIGDLYKMVDKAAEAGFSVIQLLPIQDTRLDPSPYMGISLFSLNPVFLCLDQLPDALGLSALKERVKANIASKTKEVIHYQKLYKSKVKALRLIFDNSNAAREIQIADFDHEVLSYALFLVLKDKFRQRWVNWPTEYKKGDVKSILDHHPELHKEVKFILFSQTILKQQWLDLSKYAARKGIKLALDKPIYPVHDSADVWANQGLFYLNSDGSLKYESGCNHPRDPFGPQKWGHAVYQYKEKPNEVINYYLKAIGYLALISQVIRFDHTLALIWKYYIIDPKTGAGKHLPALKKRLFLKVKENFPNLVLIAEDVGFASKRLVDDPLMELGIMGMRCLQWVNQRRYSELSSYPFSCFALTAYHNTMSLPEWWGKLGVRKRANYLKRHNSSFSEVAGSEIEKLITLVFNCPAQIASVTLRDLVGDCRRYNVPGLRNYRNWRLQMRKPIEEVDFGNIKKIIEMSGRAV